MEKRKLYNKLIKAGVSKEDIWKYAEDKKKYLVVEKWKKDVDKMLDNTHTGEDLTKLGAKMNEAIDNKYNVNIFDYQIQVAKKLREVYKRVGL